MIVMTEADCIRHEPWQIICRVIKQEGTCAAGHKVGDVTAAENLCKDGHLLDE